MAKVLKEEEEVESFLSWSFFSHKIHATAQVNESSDAVLTTQVDHRRKVGEVLVAEQIENLKNRLCGVP